MLKPTTVRVPDDFLKELQKFIKDMKLDKSAYLREIMKKGFEDDRRERLLAEYQNGVLSAGEVCKKLGISAWEFFDLLKNKNIPLNVALEDWLDSGSLAK
jgi:predicted DNA-binding protein